MLHQNIIKELWQVKFKLCNLLLPEQYLVVVTMSRGRYKFGLRNIAAVTPSVRNMIVTIMKSELIFYSELCLVAGQLFFRCVMLKFFQMSEAGAYSHFHAICLLTRLFSMQYCMIGHAKLLLFLQFIIDRSGFRFQPQHHLFLQGIFWRCE